MSICITFNFSNVKLSAYQRARRVPRNLIPVYLQISFWPWTLTLHMWLRLNYWEPPEHTHVYHTFMPLLRLFLCLRTIPFHSSQAPVPASLSVLCSFRVVSDIISCRKPSLTFKLCPPPPVSSSSTSYLTLLSLTLLAHITNWWWHTFWAEPGFNVQSFSSHSKQSQLKNQSCQSRWNLLSSPNLGHASLTTLSVLYWSS